MKLIMSLLIVFLSHNVFSQTYEIRAINKSGNICVEFRVVTGTPPNTSNIVADISFGLKWSSLYDIDLGAPIVPLTGNYNVTKSGAEITKMGIEPPEFQAFLANPANFNFPANWVTDTWVEIMCIPIIRKGSGLGTFEICGLGFSATTDPNIAIVLIPGGLETDYTPTINGSAVNVPLPVALLNFQAQAQGKTNLINWQTASEKDNQGFHIQRSAEGKNFINLGFMKGQGTTQEKQSYIFTDDAPLPISYYRLRQMDFDGKEAFSKIVSVQAGEKGRYKIYPNPAKDLVNVQFQAAKEGIVSMDLYDSIGKLIQHFNYNAREGENQSVLKVQNIAKGFYTLKIKQGEAVVTERLIID
jgi:Secretion system C-terminal sorting domain